MLVPNRSIILKRKRLLIINFLALVRVISEIQRYEPAGIMVLALNKWLHIQPVCSQLLTSHDALIMPSTFKSSQIAVI